MFNLSRSLSHLQVVLHETFRPGFYYAGWSKLYARIMMPLWFLRRKSLFRSLCINKNQSGKPINNHKKNVVVWHLLDWRYKEETKRGQAGLYEKRTPNSYEEFRRQWATASLNTQLLFQLWISLAGKLGMA